LASPATGGCICACAAPAAKTNQKAGCCDDSPNKHATAHFHATAHPIIEGYDPPEGWGWCYVDEQFVKLDHKTEQVGPIKRWV